MDTLTRPRGISAEAACTRHDPDLWFAPDHREFAHDRAVREVKAKAICAACPLQVSCLRDARARGERFGIWGGEDLEHPARRVCGNGLHLMTAANTFVTASRGRLCRACRDAQQWRKRRAS